MDRLILDDELRAKLKLEQLDQGPIDLIDKTGRVVAWLYSPEHYEQMMRRMRPDEATPDVVVEPTGWRPPNH